MTPGRAAISVAVGLLIGATPLYGLHLVLVMAVCIPLRLDVPLAYLAANVSLPFIAPFLSVAEIQAGSLVRTGAWRPLSVDAVRQQGLLPFVGDLAIGVLVFAPALAFVGGCATWATTSVAQRLRRSHAPKS